MKLFKSSGSNAKYLQVGAIGFTVIFLLWVVPKMIRIKESNTLETPLPAVTGGAVTPAGRMDVTTPGTLGLPSSIEDTIGTLRLSNVYRANSRIGISPHRQRILA